MSVVINRTNGSILTTIANSTVDTTSDLTLIGKNYTGYGEFVNENLVKLLENFSNSTAPTKALSGQLWWDTANSRLKVYNGSAWLNIFSSSNNNLAITGTTASTSTTTGALTVAGGVGVVGNVFVGGVMSGVATSARYADLAENYQADAAYEPGTVLEFGGAYEVTVAEDETRRIAGVVSTAPAYLMNTDLSGANIVSIALVGRVPTKVRGTVRKGDLMVSAGGGFARPSNDPKVGTVIGKALEDFDGIEGVIEIVVGLR